MKKKPNSLSRANKDYTEWHRVNRGVTGTRGEHEHRVGGNIFSTIVVLSSRINWRLLSSDLPSCLCAIVDQHSHSQRMSRR